MPQAIPRCPQCHKPLDGAPEAGTAEPRKFFPFCSQRCKLIDLGAWMGEKYRIASPMTDTADDAEGAPREEIRNADDDEF